MSKKRRRPRKKTKKSRNKRRKEQQKLSFEALEPRKLLAADLVVDAMGLNVELFQDGSTVQVYSDGGALLAESEIADIEDKVQVFNAYSINFESDLELDGNSLDLQANDSITLGSFYNVITTDDNNDNPINDAGDVTFDAPHITISENAVIDAWDEFFNNVPGDITLTAIDTPSLAETVFNASPLPATVNFRDPMVTLDGATLDGGMITISALGQTTTRYGDLGQFSDTIVDQLQSVDQLGLSTISPITGQAKIHDSNATVTLIDATIKSSGSVNVLADARTDASIDAIAVNAAQGTSQFLGAVGFGKAASNARVDMLGTTSITAAGDIDIESYAESIANVSSRAEGGVRGAGDVDKAFNISIALTDENSNVVLEPGASVEGGKVSIRALGKVENKAKAATSLFQPSSGSESDNEVGLSLALGVDNAIVNANIQGDVTANNAYGSADSYVFNASDIESDNVTLRVAWPADRLLSVGDRVSYFAAAAADLGLENGGEYFVAAAESDGPDGNGKIWQRIQLSRNDATIDLDSSQVPEDSTHTLSKLNKIDFHADDTSEDNFVYLPGLPDDVTEVTYLGPNLEIESEDEADFEGIVGLTQNQTYEVVATGVSDQYRLRSIETGQLLPFQVPDGGSHGFYFTETVLSFDPNTDVNNETNKIQLGPAHGLSHGDLVFYGTDPTKTIQRTVQTELSSDAGTVDLPDAPIRGLQNQLGYRVVVDPANPELIRLTTSIEAANDSRVTTFNPDADPNNQHVIVRDNPESVEIKADLDANNSANAGVALSGKEQPWADVAFTAAETDVENMVDGGTDLFIHMRLHGEDATEASSANTGANISSQGGDSSTTEFAGSLAYSLFDHDVKATVHDTAVITSAAEVDIDATIQQAVQLNTVAQAHRRGTGDDTGGGDNNKEISAALGFGEYENDAQATVSDSARIDAGGRIDIHAGIDYPLLMSDVTEGLNPDTYLERIGSAAFGSLLDGMLGISQLFNVSARTNAGDDDALALGGAVVVTDYLNNTVASIDSSRNG